MSRESEEGIEKVLKGLEKEASRRFVSEDRMIEVESLGGFGKYGSEEQEFRRPKGVCADGDSIYVVDTGNERIQVFLEYGGSKIRFERFIGKHELSSPQKAAIKQGRIYIADQSDVRIFSVYGEMAGRFKEGKDGQHYIHPRGIAVKGDLVFVGERERVCAYNLNGEYKSHFDGEGTDGSIDNIGDIAVCGDRLCVLEQREAVIKIFTLEGKYIREIGKGFLTTDAYFTKYQLDGFWNRVTGAKGTHYSCDGPKGICADSKRIFVADTQDNQIKIFNIFGEHLISFGRTGGDDDLDRPEGIAVSGDRIYVADTGNHEIKVYRMRG